MPHGAGGLNSLFLQFETGPMLFFEVSSFLLEFLFHPYNAANIFACPAAKAPFALCRFFSLPCLEGCARG